MHALKLVVLVLTALFLAAPFSQTVAKTIKFKSEVSSSKWSRTLRGSLTFPKGKGPFPVVIFLHPCGGWKKPPRSAAEAHARYLRKNGFASFILDSFGPRRMSGGKVCNNRKLASAATKFMVDDAFNAFSALQKLGKIDKKNIFLVGLSLGASSGVMASQENFTEKENSFRGIAAYYPNCEQALSPFPRFKSPLIVFGAGQDDWSPPYECSTIQEYGDWSKGPQFEVIVYPKALHAFDQPKKRYRYKGHWLGYSPSATADSRRKMVEFFKRQMKGSE